MYEKYQNDITLFTLEDIKILINYYTEHPLFSEIKTSKGYSIIQKIIYKLVIKEYNKDEEVFWIDSLKLIDIFDVLIDKMDYENYIDIFFNTGDES